MQQQLSPSKARLALSAVLGVLLSSSAYAGHTNALLVTQMDGREEVGEDVSQRLSGDPDGKGIGYVFGIDGDEFTLCYSITVNNLQLVPVGEGMAAHIHEGLRDSNGPVVAVLAGPEDGNAADCLTEGEDGKFPTGESGIVQRILNNPANFYINIHNPEYPAGAIRGNLTNTLMEDSSHSHNDPTVPTNLTAQVYSSSAAEIFWDRSDSQSLVFGYEIYRNGVSVDVTEGNSFFDDSLESGTGYEYEIVAISSNGDRSARSTTIVVTIP